MIEIRLSNQPGDNVLVTFDGHILEFFTWEERESSRYHVFKFAKIEIVTDKRGKNTLSMLPTAKTTPRLYELYFGFHKSNDFQRTAVCRCFMVKKTNPDI